jgi:DNA-binding transcriptional MocR family regulator
VNSHGPDGYTIVPNAIITDARLSNGSFRILIDLIDLLQHARQGDECWPSQELLAKRMGATSRSVRRYIEELVELGYVEVRPTIGGANTYVLHRTAAPGSLTADRSARDSGQERRGAGTESSTLPWTEMSDEEEAIENNQGKSKGENARAREASISSNRQGSGTLSNEEYLRQVAQSVAARRAAQSAERRSA